MGVFITMKQRLLARVSPQALLVAALLLLNVFFVIFRFFPTIKDISLWDDAGYINQGRTLLQGVFPKFSENPFMALLFAISYLPFQHDNFWMLHTVTVGRILMFILMWLGTCLVANQISGPKWYIMVGLMFASTVTVDIMENPSDTFFAGLSALAFWQMLSYHNTRRVKHLALTSLFIGLAALARNDGLILFALFLITSLFYLKSSQNKLQHLAAAILPFLVLVGGYVLAYGAFTGDFDLGTQERSYLAFRQGQMELSPTDPACALGPTKCAGNAADVLYGSSAENGNSIFRAIARNPRAYLQRLVTTTSLLPGLANDAYGKRLFYAWLFLAMLGIFALLRDKKYALLALCLVWIAPLGTYFLTFFRAGYLRMPLCVIFLLAGVGIIELVESLNNRRKWVWLGILLFLTVVGVGRSLNYLYFSTIILLASMALGLWVTRSRSEFSYKTELILMVFLAGGFIMRGGFTPPIIPVLGQIPEEKAILSLERRLPENSIVGAGAPGIPWEARMTYSPLSGKDFLAKSPLEYYTILKKAGVKAIYVDNIVTNNTPLWALIKPGIGKYYQLTFSGRSNSVLILLLK